MTASEMKAAMFEVYAATLGAIPGMAGAWLTGGAVVRAAWGAPASSDIDVITADYDDHARALIVDGWTKISEKLPGAENDEGPDVGSGASTARVSRWTQELCDYAIDLLELPVEKVSSGDPLVDFLSRFDLSICQVAVRGNAIVWASDTARADFFEGVVRIRNAGWKSTPERVAKYRLILGPGSIEIAAPKILPSAPVDKDVPF